MTLPYDPEPLPETIGPYAIQRRLGQGAMSDVFEGFDADHGRRVAIKLLSGDLVRDKDALQRIERESRILELINHPHVARLLTLGKTGDGRPYLVFELVLGHTLANIIADRNPVDWATGLKWMTQAAEALGEAWKNHIIHRDIKPGNMMIDHEGNLKLLDFGLAKALHAEDDGSKQRIVLGTPRYISPEMGLGQSLDFRADMYSLGATFYHLFVRQPPFDAGSPLGLVHAHAKTPLPRPHTIDPELPEDICDILEKLLEKDPGRRYQTYDDLIADLREARLALIAREESFKRPGGFSPADQRNPGLVATPSNPEGMRPPAIHLGPMLARPDVAGLQPSEGFGRLGWFFICAAIATALMVALLVYLSRDGETASNPPPPIPAPRIKLLEPPTQTRIRADELEAENRDRMERVMSIIIRYQMRHDRLPAGLEQLVRDDLASEELILDSWNNRFDYDPATGELASQGADGTEKTGDEFTLDLDLKFKRLPGYPAAH